MGWSRLNDNRELMPAPTPQEVAPNSPHLNADAFPVGNKATETQLPSFLPWKRRGLGEKKGLLGWQVRERLPWGEEFGCWCQRSVSSEGVPSSAGGRRPLSRPRPLWRREDWAPVRPGKFWTKFPGHYRAEKGLAASVLGLLACSHTWHLQRHNPEPQRAKASQVTLFCHSSLSFIFSRD